MSKKLMIEVKPIFKSTRTFRGLDEWIDVATSQRLKVSLEMLF
jgi:hypothetical protein